METKSINKGLVVAYFGLKTKHNNQELKNLTREEILQLTVDKLPKKLFCNAVKAVNEKYGIKINAEHFYKLAPAILISEIGDVFEEYPRLHKRQIIRLFEKTASAKKETLVSSKAIPAPLTIDLIDWISNHTMRELKYANLERAMDDGEKITVGDIADFFSEREGRKIAKILARISRPKISRETVKSYIADSCGKAAEEIDEEAPITGLRPSVGSCGNYDCYVVLSWTEGEFNKTVPNAFTESRTIGELIDFLAQ